MTKTTITSMTAKILITSTKIEHFSEIILYSFNRQRTQMAMQSFSGMHSKKLEIEVMDRFMFQFALMPFIELH